MSVRLDPSQVKTFDLKLSVYVSSKLLKHSTSIAKRLEALTNIKNIAKEASANDGSRLSKFTSYFTRESARVTAPMAISWFKDVSIVSYLNNFENKEMAQASISILAFIKKYIPETDVPDVLDITTEHIAMMHESARENLFNGLLSLIGVMSKREISKTINVLKVVPVEDHSNSSIVFVGTVAGHCTSNQEPLKILGNILWDIFHSDAPSEYIQSLAFEQFIRLIEKPYFELLRGGYFTQCMSDMDNNVFVYKSTIIMERILNLSSGFLNSPQNKVLINLLNIFVSSFVTYYVCTEQKVLSMKQGGSCIIPSDEDIENTRFEEGKSHKEQIAKRLHFLKFISQKYKIKIPTKYVVILWNTFHDHYVCDRDKDMFYAWLLECVVTLESIVCMAEMRDSNPKTGADMCTIFNECVLKSLSSSGNYISKNLFDVITRFFVISNLYNNTVLCEPPKDKREDKDKSKDVIERSYASTIALIGFNDVVSAVTRAVNNDIFIDSINFLNSLFRKDVNNTNNNTYVFILLCGFIEN